MPLTNQEGGNIKRISEQIKRINAYITHINGESNFPYTGTACFPYLFVRGKPGTPEAPGNRTPRYIMNFDFPRRGTTGEAINSNNKL